LYCSELWLSGKLNLKTKTSKYFRIEANQKHPMNMWNWYYQDSIWFKCRSTRKFLRQHIWYLHNLYKWISSPLGILCLKDRKFVWNVIGKIRVEVLWLLEEHQKSFIARTTLWKVQLKTIIRAIRDVWKIELYIISTSIRYTIKIVCSPFDFSINRHAWGHTTHGKCYILGGSLKDMMK